ncbi:tetratricopeptide repeat protein [Paracrocinitomix mangrovi]|uniref:tetratricopeptide repeat protein n=1 Tax=Paracrocinitomix mangrovi TaxID=2862509 RepID=UPI001C8F17AC|nr:tetratricopeptide repeat protein [Paracrocinitomix mangrovi]UKN01130.1 tetratricopeptide repeat protein [Paracrocinitomix mangrovi]
MKIQSLIILLLIAFSAEAQLNADSLEQNIHNRDLDTNLINDYIKLSNHYESVDSIKSFKYVIQAEATADQLKNRIKKADALVQHGQLYLVWELDRSLALEYYSNALLIYRSEGERDKEMKLILSMGYVYRALGREDEAYEMYQEALNLYPDDHKFACVINNAIGVQMKSIGEDSKAIQYMDESEIHYVQIDNPNAFLIERQLSNDKNRGVVYRNNESFDTAEFYLNRSLQKSIEIQDSAWMARNYNSIAILYQQQNLILQAIEIYEKSLVIKRNLNYVDGTVTTLSNLGSLYLKMGNYKKAKDCYEEADLLSEKFKIPARQVQVLDGISELYYKTGNYKESYEKLRKYIDIRDSLDEIYNKEQSKELEAKYNNEMLKIEEEKLEAELLAADLREKNKAEQIERQQNFLILGTSLGLVLFAMVIIAIRSNIKRKAANQELQLKNEEISSKSDKIEIQKQQIEEKNQEIFDSINYAKRIQEAIMPNTEFVKTHLPESFIYYQPKDILAGDFYWMDIIEDTVIWAAADCTGHGIPGAMVSVVCHNALNRSVHEFGHKEPGKILDCTRDLVIETFKKSGMKVKDGMDIALCCFDKSTSKLKFAGANNPLWLVRKIKEGEVDEKDFVDTENGILLKEFKGDKQPIGLHYEYSSFNTVEIDILKDDLLYVFTDGYADQFGGEKGKKLKYKNLKKLLLDNANSSIEFQGEVLANNFNQWKGDFEQLDDVCIIGVKL